MATSTPVFRVAVRTLNPVLNDCEEPTKGPALGAGTSCLPASDLKVLGTYLSPSLDCKLPEDRSSVPFTVGRLNT